MKERRLQNNNIISNASVEKDDFMNKDEIGHNIYTNESVSTHNS